MSRNANYLTDLHKLISRSFSLAEIRTLCFDLNVDYENIAGEEKQSRIRELLLVFARRGRLPELIQKLQFERPHIAWPPVPEDFELPEAVASGGPAVPLTQHYHYYGDVVQGDKVNGDKVDGDKITVGNITKSSGIAIGRAAQASVQIQQGVPTEQMNQLFAPLLIEVARTDETVVPAVQELKKEVSRGEEADDEKVADLIGDIAEAVPTAVEGLVNLFTNSVIAKAVGGVTKYVLKRIRK